MFPIFGISMLFKAVGTGLLLAALTKGGCALYDKGYDKGKKVGYQDGRESVAKEIKQKDEANQEDAKELEIHFGEKKKLYLKRDEGGDVPHGKHKLFFEDISR